MRPTANIAACHHSHRRQAAAAGKVARVHPTGYAPDAAASAGAGKAASKLLADLEHGLVLLEATWDALDDAHWKRQATMMAGPRTVAEVVDHHLRNIEVHHVDLDIDCRVADWPTIFVETELPKRLRRLPERADEAELLAWLMDRAPAPRLEGRW